MEATLRAVLKIKGAEIISVPPRATVYHAIETMNAARIGSVLIIDDEALVGIFSERDVLTRVIPGGHDPHTLRVDAVMTRRLTTAAPEDRVGDTLALMTRRRIRHLPVIEDGRLIGIVSIGDLTKWITESLRKEVSELSAYIASPYALNPKSVPPDAQS